MTQPDDSVIHQKEGGSAMATVSFGKNVVVNEPESVSILVSSLLDDEPRAINKQLASQHKREEGELLLIQFSVFSRVDTLNVVKRHLLLGKE